MVSVERCMVLVPTTFVAPLTDIAEVPLLIVEQVVNWPTEHVTLSLLLFYPLLLLPQTRMESVEVG